MIVYIITTSLGLITLKLGSEKGAPISVLDGRLLFNLTPLNVLGFVLYAASFILYTYLIAKNDLGYIIPITTALVYVIIFVASYFIFKESFTIYKILGISLIVMGLALLNFRS